jgi:hemolysin III
MLGSRLLAQTSDFNSTLAASISIFSNFILFACSSLYHRGSWTLAQERMVLKFDHSGIFVMIGGCYAPALICGLGNYGWAVLGVNFMLTVAGVALVFSGNHNNSRLMVASTYTAQSICGLLPLVHGWTTGALTGTEISQVAAMAISVMLGAVCYVNTWPNISPKHFSFHETFHACVIVGALFIYATNTSAIRRYAASTNCTTPYRADPYTWVQFAS